MGLHCDDILYEIVDGILHCTVKIWDFTMMTFIWDCRWYFALYSENMGLHCDDISYAIVDGILHCTVKIWDFTLTMCDRKYEILFNISMQYIPYTKWKLYHCVAALNQTSGLIRPKSRINGDHVALCIWNWLRQWWIRQIYPPRMRFLFFCKNFWFVCVKTFLVKCFCFSKRENTCFLQNSSKLFLFLLFGWNFCICIF